MAKQTSTRGGTRPLQVRLREAEDRAALLRKRVESADLKREIGILRSKLFKR